jgi:hypothetical protein
MGEKVVRTTGPGAARRRLVGLRFAGVDAMPEGTACFADEPAALRNFARLHQLIETDNTIGGAHTVELDFQ